MTVTLSPESADLLGRTGHAWPAADEDRIAAMAQDWRTLGVGLGQVRADHLDATRAVQAAGSGAGITAFSDWGADVAAHLLPLVELCAQVEARLIRVADNLYATKIAILGVLDSLAHQLEQLRRDVAEVPLIGEALEAGVEKIVEPAYAYARTSITNLVNGLSEVLVDVTVPALVTVTEGIKGALQGLRKLIRFELGADWPTTPTDYPNPVHKPHGPLAEPDPEDNDAKRRGLRLENEAAVTLAQAGYDVEQKPDVPGPKVPDYRINGKIFDCYSPTTSRVRNIWDLVRRGKINSGQTDRVIINLDAPDAQADVSELRRQFQNYPIPGLVEAKVIAPGGAIVDIYP